MQPETQPPPSSTSRFYTQSWFWLVVIVFTPVVVFVVWRTLLGFEVSRKLDQVKAAGYPTTGAELNRYYAAVPDDQNAAFKLVEAFAGLRSYSDTRSNDVLNLSLNRTEILDDSAKKLLSELIEMNQPAMEKAVEALKRSKSRYPLDFSSGPNTPLPHLQQIRAAARLFRYKARLGCDSGDGSAIVQPVESIMALGRTLDNEPLMLSQLVRMAVLSMGAAEVQHCLTSKALTEPELDRLASCFGFEQTNRLATALIGERANLIPVFRMSLREMRQMGDYDQDSSVPPPALKGKKVTGLGLTGFFERDLSFFLDCMETNIAAAKLPWPDALQQTNRLEELRAEAAESHYIYTGNLMPAMSRAFASAANQAAQIRVTQAAIAIERYRLANGHLPGGLAELVPQFMPVVSQDPFDGKPTRFKTLQKGYVVYSVGRDGVDDGGKERPPRKKGAKGTSTGSSNETSDVTFIVDR